MFLPYETERSTTEAILDIYDRDKILSTPFSNVTLSSFAV